MKHMTPMSETRPPEVDSLLSSLVDLVSAWTSNSFQARIAQGVGLAINESDVRTIHTLGTLGEARPAELAEAVYASRPTISKSLARLTEAGLITRRASENDGRASHITLTPKGADAYTQLVDAGIGLVQQALAEVPEMRAHAAAFTRFVTALRSTTPPAPTHLTP